MSKLYKYNELYFALVLIFIYCFINSLGNGIFDLMTLSLNVLLVIFIIYWLKKNNLMKVYGLCKPINNKETLYYIPLFIFITNSLWSGITIQNSFYEIIIYVLLMCCVGFLEEIIFRGFLFVALKKENMKMAIVISSMTFGMGHILNLFNGMDLVNNMIQIIGAMIIGLLFILIFIYSKSLIPCIIAHSINNALTIFSVHDYSVYLFIGLIIMIIYIYYIVKKKSYQ